MTVMPPARIGARIEDVDTPALIVDLDAFEGNIARMAGIAAGYGVALRPHAKTHKSVDIARQQIAAGAVGQCCQKVGEAEALAAGGIADVLITNEIVGRSKLDRLAALSRRVQVAVCADDATNVAAINEAAGRFQTRIETLVELDVGAGRCGVPSAAEAVALARQIDAAENLTFGGLQAYHGRAQHIPGWGERKATIEKAGGLVRQTVADLAAAGLACRLVTGAGTGSHAFEAESGIWNELQTGSYCFMDASYRGNLDAAGEEDATFQQSLFVLATVMSHPTRDRALVDAGHKAAAIDSGLPQVSGLRDVNYVGASDEHGTLSLGPGATGAASAQVTLGDKLRLIPGHCDPTVNLHDWYVGVRGGVVEALWPVSARGAMF